jgi:hypothetical protein
MGPFVRQEDLLRAGIDQGGGDAALLDIGEALGGEQDADILLAQGLEPSPDAGGEQAVVEEQPGLVENQQRRRAGKTLLEAMEDREQARASNGLMPVIAGVSEFNYKEIFLRGTER